MVCSPQYVAIPAISLYVTNSFYTGDSGASVYTEIFAALDYITDLVVAHPGEMIINADYVSSGYSVMMRPVEDPPAPWVPAGNRPWVEAGSYELLTRVFGGVTRGVLQGLTVIIDAEDEQEIIVNFEVADTGTRLPILKTYSQIKAVSISILEDGGDAVSSRVLDHQTDIGNGPLIELRDSNNVLVSGHVTAT